MTRPATLVAGLALVLMADAKLLSVEFFHRNVSAAGDDPAAEEVVQPQ